MCVYITQIIRQLNQIFLFKNKIYLFLTELSIKSFKDERIVENTNIYKIDNKILQNNFESFFEILLNKKDVYGVPKTDSNCDYDYDQELTRLEDFIIEQLKKKDIILNIL